MRSNGGKSGRDRSGCAETEQSRRRKGRARLTYAIPEIDFGSIRGYHKSFSNL